MMQRTRAPIPLFLWWLRGLPVIRQLLHQHLLLFKKMRIPAADLVNVELLLVAFNHEAESEVVIEFFLQFAIHRKGIPVSVGGKSLSGQLEQLALWTVSGLEVNDSKPSHFTGSQFVLIPEHQKLALTCNLVSRYSTGFRMISAADYFAPLESLRKRKATR
jgi:hypothetical protein